MTVETTDYTPDGKTLSQCSPVELLETMRTIDHHGMLRMHASNRLKCLIEDEVESRGLGVFEYRDDALPEERGFIYSIAERKQFVNLTAHYHALCGEDQDGKDHFWVIDGPLVPRLAEIRAVLDKPKTPYVAPAPSPNAPFCVTGVWTSPPSQRLGFFPFS